MLKTPLFLAKSLTTIYAAVSKLNNRSLYQVDIVIFLVAPLIALFLRLEGLKDIQLWTHWGLLVATLFFVIAKLLLLWKTGFYRRYWRYAGTDELMFIAGLAIASAMINIVCLHVIYALLSPPNLPRSLPLLDALLSFIGIGLVRFSIRFADAAQRRSQMNLSGERLLIVGAGVAGVALAEDMLRHPHLGYLPIAFIDDDPLKQGLKVRGIPIVGDRSDIPRQIHLLNIHRIIIAIPSASGTIIRQLLKSCQDTNIKTSTLPGLAEILSGRVKAGSVRPLKIEDLLRRDPVQTNIDQVKELLKGKHVLVTGAGGSIGSELCRQILKCDPAAIILMGHGENSIFLIHQELQQILHDLNANQQHIPLLHPIIADMRHQSRLELVFERFNPDVIFHGAAHKHVPMMEHNPTEAITNNVIGTQNLLNCALQYHVQYFVMISSDKAVKPTSVMGASKRVAEFLVLDTARRSGRCFSVVRFGNVLGSRGSVIPTFQRQIDAGGPITITHPSITRYFMTIPEAVQLVLQASVFSKGGEVFMLNMGNPIKIVDLAQDLIRLSGYELGRDIEIKYTGLRPGEKLFEELLITGEEYQPTLHEKILVVDNACQIVPPNLSMMIDSLCQVAIKNKENLILLLLKQLVVDYTPDTHHVRRMPELLHTTIGQENDQSGLSLSAIENDENELLINQYLNFNLPRELIEGKSFEIDNTLNKKDKSIQFNARQNITADLENALKRQEFKLLYQPIMGLANRQKLKGFEVLLRWQHQKLGSISPIQFIPLAEESDMILSIGWWVIKEVCSQLRVWREEFPEDISLTISINLTKKQLFHPSLITEIQKNLEVNGLNGTDLQLEINESMIRENSDTAIDILSQLKKLSVQLQIDNFGKSHLFHQYLNSFSNDFYQQFNRIKVDRFLINRIDHDPESLDMVHTIAENSYRSGLEMIAAGVENIQQLTQLQTMQCKYGQGYFFSKPIDAETVRGFLGKDQVFSNG